MAYSKAYQTVIAGRVREDESITMFRDNEIATPARITSFKTVGGKMQPTIEEDKANEFVGKAVNLGGVTSTKRNKGAYNPPGNNLT